jgi:uncharacterized membrane protein YoaT (DUF817 family)
MTLKDRIKAEVAALDVRARPWAARSRWHARAYEFLLFGLKQAWACLFGGAMLALLVGTHLVAGKDAALARYDFLVVAALAIQIALLALKLERWDEALVIWIFHAVGTVMEIFKTAHGSWIYPEPSLLRIERRAAVHGFMYACVGSYIARAWRLFDIPSSAIRRCGAPGSWRPGLFQLLHPPLRTRYPLGLFALSAVLFGRSWFQFTPDEKPRRMPMIVWACCWSRCSSGSPRTSAPAGAWAYPTRSDGWRWCRPSWAPGIC